MFIFKMDGNNLLFRIKSTVYHSNVIVCFLYTATLHFVQSASMTVLEGDDDIWVASAVTNTTNKSAWINSMSLLLLNSGP